jgi:hypothetical protein
MDAKQGLTRRLEASLDLAQPSTSFLLKPRGRLLTFSLNF